MADWRQNCGAMKFIDANKPGGSECDPLFDRRDPELPGKRCFLRRKKRPRKKSPYRAKLRGIM